MKTKKRLDVSCVERGLFDSRAKAQAAIMAGNLVINGKTADKAGHSVKDTDEITIAGNSCPYVSRGGFKLKAALDHFKIEIRGRVCADIGVATGGFTDCLLQAGASKVYAVDVGKGQIDDKIRQHPKVVFIPETNARFLKPDIFKPAPSFIAIDVSFISLKLILPPVIAALAEKGEIVALIKPQFELTPKQVPGGIVRSDEFRQEAVETLRKFLEKPEAGGQKPELFRVKELGLIESPIKGAKGNIEYLWHLTNGKDSQ